MGARQSVQDEVVMDQGGGAGEWITLIREAAQWRAGTSATQYRKQIREEEEEEEEKIIKEPMKRPKKKEEEESCWLGLNKGQFREKSECQTLVMIREM